MEKDFEIPTTEQKALVRNLAKEDGTTFAVAMRGFDAMENFLRNFRRRLHLEHENRGDGIDLQRIDSEINEIRMRILNSRKILGISLITAVRIASFDAPSSRPASTKRKCRHKNCKKLTLETSYYWCDKHNEPVDSEDTSYGFYRRNGRIASSY
jgi:hypothetical protein